MNPYSVKGDIVEAELRQIGATTIKCIHGKQYFIEFKLDKDWTIAYAYNINAENEYYLQRVEPYPLQHGVFKKITDLSAFIKQDVDKFINAKNSSNFKKFVEITNRMQNIGLEMEELFLNYNVDGVALAQLETSLESLFQQIQIIEKHSRYIK
ncbi:MAG: hypothetical protein U0M15_04195 [Bacillota bacterium]|nr:hypothetical protein [Bacillota bacterium]